MKTSSFWDRLFRTFSMRDDPHPLCLGFEEFDSAEHHTLIDLLATPMKQVARKHQPQEDIP